MDYKLKQPLLWVAILILGLPVVFAAGQFADILAPFEDLLGVQGWAGVVDNNPAVFDSVAFTIIFIMLGLIAGRRIGQGGLGATVGAILGIITSAGLYRAGFSLNQLAPLLSALLFLALLMGIYWMFHSFIKNRIVAACLGFTFVWWMIPSSLRNYMTSNGFGAWFNLIWAFSVIGLIIYLIKWFVNGARGGGGFSGGASSAWGGLSNAFGGGGNHSPAHTSQAVDALDSVESDADRELAEELNREQAQAARPPAEQLDAQLNERVGQDAAAEAASEMQVAKNAQQFRTTVENVLDFVKGVQATYKQLTSTPGIDVNTINAQINAGIEQLKQYFALQRNQFGVLEQEFLAPDKLAQDEQLERDVQARVEKQELLEFDAENKFYHRIEQHEGIIKAVHEEASQAVKDAPPQGWQEAQSIINLYANHESEYTEHLKLVGELRETHNNVRKEIEAIKEEHHKMQQALEKRKAILGDTKTKLTQMPQHFESAWPKLLTALSERTDSSYDAAMAEGKILVDKIKEIEGNGQMRVELANEVTKAIEDLKQKEPMLTQLKKQFDRDLKAVLQQEGKLDAVATAAVIAADHTRTLDDYSPAHLGLESLGIKDVDMRLTKVANNTAKVKKFIEGKTGAVRNKVQNAYKKYEKKPEGQIFVAVLQAFQKQTDRVTQDWNGFIEKRSRAIEEAIRTAQEAAAASRAAAGGGKLAGPIGKLP